MICTVLGYSRQAYYKQRDSQEQWEETTSAILSFVRRERKILPRIGGKKLYWLLENEFEQSGIKCGRDKLFSVLREHGLLLKRKKRYTQTTMSKHWMRKYPNLLKGCSAERPNHIWVSDITYVATDEGYCYLSLLTDAYSRKILGYHVCDSLSTEGPKKAFEMALRQRTSPEPVIHHSDRGYQYCSKEYVELATRHNVQMSMTEHSDPYENALAERMNRTLKEEFAIGQIFASKNDVLPAVEDAVRLYNTYRPHLSLRKLTPEIVHQ